MTDIPSPLASTNPDAIGQLFSTDPTTLSDPDLDTLILEVRRRRNEFNSTEAAKLAKGKSAKEPKPPIDAATAAAMDKPPGELSLDDLE